MKFPKLNFLKKKTENMQDRIDNKIEKEKIKKLTNNSLRVRINRLMNNTPVEIDVFTVNMNKDKYNNTVLVNEDKNFKEELPDHHEVLISDILYKLENRGLSKEAQLEKVTAAIKKQEKKLSIENKGYVETNEKDKENKPIKIKINKNTEKTKLRLLKCVKYTIEYLKGEGSFEKVSKDGTRELSYLIRDGDLIPYYCKTPISAGEPVILVPDIVQRKKFYKETTDEAIQDFNENQDWKLRGWFGVISKIITLLLFFGLVFWTFHNARWQGELAKQDNTEQLNQLKIQSERIRQECSQSMVTQIDNNQIIMEWAKSELEKKTKENLEQDKNNINI